MESKYEMFYSKLITKIKVQGNGVKMYVANCNQLFMP